MVNTTIKGSLLCAHVMVWCPKNNSKEPVMVTLLCKKCDYCNGIITDPTTNEITGVYCVYEQ